MNIAGRSSMLISFGVKGIEIIKGGIVGDFLSRGPQL